MAQTPAFNLESIYVGFLGESVMNSIFSIIAKTIGENSNWSVNGRIANEQYQNHCNLNELKDIAYCVNSFNVSVSVCTIGESTMLLFGYGNGNHLNCTLNK